MKKAEKSIVLEELASLYPDAKPALRYTTAYELLVAVILSAQCTDERVNKVTAVLFEKYSTPQAMVTLSQKELEEYIFSCGFYRMKAEHILSASKDILEKFGGEVPNTVESLMELAGVGKKTANVVYSVAFGGAAIAVDTHVFRVAARIGLSVGAKTPRATELQLEKYIPSALLPKAHHWLILHGRYTCIARRPKCGECGIAPWCKYFHTHFAEK